MNNISVFSGLVGKYHYTEHLIIIEADHSIIIQTDHPVIIQIDHPAKSLERLF